jgi:peroxiredoxin
VLSPQLPVISLEMRAQMKLGFDVLFDAGNKVAEAYGIAMQLPDDLIKVYASLAKGGTVLGIDADPDYTRRPEPEETLAVLRG